jgi:hypothetical protein
MDVKRTVEHLGSQLRGKLDVEEWKAYVTTNEREFCRTTDEMRGDMRERRRALDA